MAAIQESMLDLSVGGGGGSGFGGGALQPGPPPALPPAQLFDLAPISGLRDSDKYRGNLVSDLKSAYQTYLSGVASGRGGQYAADAQRKYGYGSIREAASSYLQTAGLTFLADAVQPTPTPTPAPVDPAPTPTPTPVDPAPKSPTEILIDSISKLFGGAVYNPPLQSQASGYTPISVPSSGDTGTSGGITMWLIIGAVAIGGYFLYKKYKG